MSKSRRDETPEPEDEVEIETALLNAVAGDEPGEYFVLANWNHLPIDPLEINGCIVSVRSLADQFQWKTRYELDTWIFVVRRLPSGRLLVGTSDGTLIRISQGNIEIIDTGIESGITDIWVLDEQSCWLAHAEGVSHWDGNRISRQGPTSRVNVLHGLSPDFAVAVGHEGLVLLFDGIKWQKVDSSPTNKPLVSVFCIDRDQIFVGGWRGALYKWDGATRWRRIDFMDDIASDDHNIMAIVQYRGDIYACVGEHGLYRIQGSAAERVHSFYCDHATVINESLVITGGILFAEFDGTDWAQVEINLPD